MGETRLQIEALRRELHKAPEVSGCERETAALIFGELRACAPVQLETGLGGHGVAAVFGPGDVRESITLRAELDALPISEHSGATHASGNAGVMHACGHDGHMAILIDLARRFAASPPPCRVTLLFQPAEETGEGAASVIADPRWPDLRAQRAFALHNDPGRPLGEIALRAGEMAAASIGLRFEWLGATAHASLAERDDSPARIAARFIERAPTNAAPGQPLAQTTIAHASIGQPTFGISPGSAVVHVSCRGETTALRDQQAERARKLADELRASIELRVTEHEPFIATVNDGAACETVRAAARACGSPVVELAAPQPWSEDFGRLIEDAPAGGALLLIGSGESQPPLHDPRFDFPDAIIPRGADVFERIVRG